MLVILSGAGRLFNGAIKKRLASHTHPSSVLRPQCAQCSPVIATPSWLYVTAFEVVRLGGLPAGSDGHAHRSLPCVDSERLRYRSPAGNEYTRWVGRQLGLTSGVALLLYLLSEGTHGVVVRHYVEETHAKQSCWQQRVELVRVDQIELHAAAHGIAISGISHQSSATSHQSPVTSHQPPVISHQSSATSHQSPLISHQSSVIRPGSLGSRLLTPFSQVHFS